MTGKYNFIANAVGLVNSRNQNMNIYIYIVAFYPKDSVKDSDLEKFKKGDIIKVQGRFSIIKTEVNESKVKLIKVVASDICILNLDEEDLSRSSLSVILIDTASGNPKIRTDKVTLDLNAREYIDNQNNGSLLFNLYHFPEDSHLLPITTKISRGTLLYVSGYLLIIEDLFLIRMTQINFIESPYSTIHKPSNYAWEKRQDDSST
ncbi:7839_t:CDS:2 [Funneliformis geosporum]|uniref:7839_t:CDS:1 n=1 Tax=Funneliformis geosporum TaxID=1117311 RepID=A0A9W4WZX2_9GLOM|nr:7839_t:CDS:2 [Funneliformis geosporum]